MEIHDDDGGKGIYDVIIKLNFYMANSMESNGKEGMEDVMDILSDFWEELRILAYCRSVQNYRRVQKLFSYEFRICRLYLLGCIS